MTIEMDTDEGHAMYGMLANNVHCTMSSDNGTLFKSVKMSTLPTAKLTIMVSDRCLQFFIPIAR
jgi:hypothetical protein